MFNCFTLHYKTVCEDDIGHVFFRSETTNIRIVLATLFAPCLCSNVDVNIMLPLSPGNGLSGAYLLFVIS